MIGWEFSNLNSDSLENFQGFLLKKGFNSKMKTKGIWIYNRLDIHRYFNEIGTNNPKHISKYSNYFKQFGGMRERPIRPVWRTGVPQGTVGSNPTPSAKFAAANFSSFFKENL